MKKAWKDLEKHFNIWIKHKIWTRILKWSMKQKTNIARNIEENSMQWSQLSYDLVLLTLLLMQFVKKIINRIKTMKNLTILLTICWILWVTQILALTTLYNRWVKLGILWENTVSLPYICEIATWSSSELNRHLISVYYRTICYANLLFFYRVLTQVYLAP